jgi:putative ABC transport system permease protein
LKLHRGFLYRELRAGWRQLALFLLCVISAVLAVGVVGGWRHAIETGMARDSRLTSGGDVVVFSTLPFSKKLLETVEKYPHLTSQEMFTVAIDPKTDKTLFSKLKAVEAGYPLYGEAPLASGKPIQEALKSGLVVEPKLLTRLNVKVGDQLKIGERTFPIVDVCLKEPDRPFALFSVSSRIFIGAAQLESTGLVAQSGSYVERSIQIKLDDAAQTEQVAERLRNSAIPDQEKVSTWLQPPQSIRRFVKNFFLFLDMVAAFTVALGGLGMQSTLRAWLRGRSHVLTVVRTLGANHAWTVRHYSTLVAFVTLIGVGFGLSTAHLILAGSGEVLTKMLPTMQAPYLGLKPALQAAFLGIVASAGFTFLPLRGLKDMRPKAAPTPPSPRTQLATVASLLLTTFALLSLMSGEILRAAYSTAGLATLVALVWGLARAGLAAMKRWRPSKLDLRTGLRGMLSGGATTLAVMTVLGSTLSVLFTLGLCEAALDKAWVQAMPPDAPNLVFFDIQPNQADAFRKAFGGPIEVYPTMRVRLQEVDGVAVLRNTPREPGEPDKRREFRGSCRVGSDPQKAISEIDPDERLVGASTLFKPGSDQNQVSVLDSVAKTSNIKVGSKLTITIQGVPTEVTVSSLRHVEKETFRPTFDLLFPPEMVAQAPKTMFATARVNDNEIAAVQSKVALALPSVTSMDISETIQMVATKLTQLLTLTRLLLLLGVLPGGVILVSAALASRLERQRESAYYKVLGATRGFVLRVVIWENLLLGLCCSTLGILLATACSWSLCYWLWDVPFVLTAGMCGAMLIIPTSIVTLLGLALSIPVVRSRPAVFLRPSA